MGLTDDEIEQLPFLDLNPPERLFDCMRDRQNYGNKYQAMLFDRPVLIEIGMDSEYEEYFGDEVEGAIAWAKISSRDPHCAEIAITIDANSNWTGQDTYSFSAGYILHRCDDCDWEQISHDQEQLQSAILDYTRNTIHYGYFESWQGPLKTYGNGELRYPASAVSGPLRSNDRSRGWLRRAIELENQALLDAHQSSESSLADCLAWGLLVIIAIPILILMLPIIFVLLLKYWAIHLFGSRMPHARRYPPFPLN